MGTIKNPDRKPTVLHKRAFDKLVESGGNVPMGQIMIRAGFSPETAKSPQKLTESKGFKKLMAQYGLTQELIANSLVEDITAKKGNRIGELNLGAKILKMTEENKSDDFQPVKIIINQLNVSRGEDSNPASETESSS